MLIRELITRWGFDVDDAPLKRLEGDVNNIKKMALGAGAAIAAVGGSLVKVISDASQNEAAEIAFETILGSAEKAKVLMQDLEKFAEKTPFEFVDLQSQTKQLMAMGIGAEGMIDTMKALGDVAAGVGTPMSRLAYNYGQIKSKGKADSIDLKQFAMAGIPIYEELANSLGKNVDQVRAMGTAGQITFPVIEEAFRKMTSEGGKYDNLMIKLSSTATGMWSNIMDIFGGISRATGKGVLEQAKSYLKVVMDFLEANKKNIIALTSKKAKQALDFFVRMFKFAKSLVVQVNGLTKAFGGLEGVLKYVMYAFGVILAMNILSAFGNMAIGIWNFARGLVAAAKAAKMMNFTLAKWPILVGLLIALFAALASELYGFFNDQDNLIDRFFENAFGKATWDRYKDNVLNALKDMKDGIADLVMNPVKFFSEALVNGDIGEGSGNSDLDAVVKMKAAPNKWISALSSFSDVIGLTGNLYGLGTGRNPVAGLNYGGHMGGIAPPLPNLGVGNQGVNIEKIEVNASPDMNQAQYKSVISDGVSDALSSVLKQSKADYNGGLEN